MQTRKGPDGPALGGYHLHHEIIHRAANQGCREDIGMKADRSLRRKQEVPDITEAVERCESAEEEFTFIERAAKAVDREREIDISNEEHVDCTQKFDTRRSDVRRDAQGRIKAKQPCVDRNKWGIVAASMQIETKFTADLVEREEDDNRVNDSDRFKEVETEEARRDQEHWKAGEEDHEYVAMRTEVRGRRTHHTANHGNAKKYEEYYFTATNGEHSEYRSEIHHLCKPE